MENRNKTYGDVSVTERVAYKTRQLSTSNYWNGEQEQDLWKRQCHWTGGLHNQDCSGRQHHWPRKKSVLVLSLESSLVWELVMDGRRNGLIGGNLQATRTNRISSWTGRHFFFYRFFILKCFQFSQVGKDFLGEVYVTLEKKLEYLICQLYFSFLSFSYILRYRP